MRRLVLVFIVMLFVGCAKLRALYSVGVLKDDFEGTTLYRMQHNALESDPGVMSFDLNLQKFQDKNGTSVMLVDGERIGFSGNGSTGLRKVDSGAYVSVTEHAFYNIKAEQVAKIINAKNVRVRLYGERAILDNYFSVNNFRNFSRFASEYMSPNPLSSS